MAQALGELELEVERCPDIFTAIAALTTRNFDVIVADWDEGLEARFLLENARDLKSSGAAFRVAIVPGSASADGAQGVGIHHAFQKPITVEDVKYALLTSEEFLLRMKAWLAEILPRSKPSSKDGSQPLNSPAGAAPSISSDQPIYTDYANRLVSASAPPALFRNLRVSPGRHASRLAGYHIPLLIVLAVGIALVGDLFSEPRRMTALRDNAIQISEHAVSLTHRLLASAGSPQSQPLQARSEDKQTNSVPLEVSRNPGFRKNPRQSAPSLSVGPAVLTTSYADYVPPHTAMVPAMSLVPDSLRQPLPSSASALNPLSLIVGAQPVSVPEELSASMVIQRVPPTYPQQAVQARLQGPVVLQARIGADGVVRELKLVRGYLVLGRAAYDAVRQWRYKPYIVNGRAVETQTYVTLNFQLPS